MLQQLNLILTLFLSFLIFQSFGQKNVSKDSVIKITPPYQQFYSKYLNNEGIPIRSGDVVSDTALKIASGKINTLLKQIPIVRSNLVANGVELHIIGKNQQTSDLPEYWEMKGLKYIDNGILTDVDTRTRGMGGIYASCGEENLLGLPGDRYAGGYDICTHEFSHTIMGFGLDSILLKKINLQYHSSIGKGLWKGAYASTNEQEYWAELSTWYFGAHGDFVQNTLTLSGPSALKAYDLAGYNLLDSIYSGKINPKKIIKKSTSVPRNTPSLVSDQKSKLNIINNSKKDLRIFWVDYNGKSILEKTIPPSTSFSKDTFYNHVWLIDGGQTPIYIKVFDPICNIELSKNF